MGDSTRKRAWEVWCVLGVLALMIYAEVRDYLWVNGLEEPTRSKWMDAEFYFWKISIPAWCLAVGMGVAFRTRWGWWSGVLGAVALLVYDAIIVTSLLDWYRGQFDRSTDAGMREVLYVLSVVIPQILVVTLLLICRARGAYGKAADKG